MILTEDFILKYWLQVLFGAITTGLVAGYRKLYKKNKELCDKNKAMEYGMRALLRDRIIQSYNHYHEEKGYCPIYVKDAIDDMYNQYHALGGNGTITKLHEELMALPTEPKERND